MNLNNQQLKEILDELYKLDDNLRAKEQELIKIIMEVAAKRLKVEFDDRFRIKLRARIMEQAKAGSSLASLTIKYNPMKKLIYAVSFAVLAVIIIVPSFYLLKEKKSAKFNLTRQAPILAINKVAANSFGSLISKVESTVQNQNTGAASFRASQANGAGEKTLDGKTQGAAGAPVNNAGREAMLDNSAKSAANLAPLGQGGSGVVADVSSVNPDAKIMPPYQIVTYRYVYKGKDLPEIQAQMDVLKRNKISPTDVNMADLVNGLNIGLADLNSFSGLNLQNVTFTQAGDNSYIISVSPEEGAISISQNWQAWPAAKCGNDFRCFENTQKVNESDMLPDAELFKITGAFLADHGIDKKFYGDPVVSYNWRILYEASPDKSNFYFPNSLDVTYPLKINDKTVYEEYNGQKQGLNISVDVKNKKVSNLYNLTTQNYDSSAYDMETDPKKIIAYAERGGVNNVYYIMKEGGNGKEVELELGNPELGYIRHYSYETGKNSEILVPALIFPVTNSPKDQPYYYRQAVVVPLAKEILTEREKQLNQQSVDFSGGAGGGVSGSEPAMLKAETRPVK